MLCGSEFSPCFVLPMRGCFANTYTHMPVLYKYMRGIEKLYRPVFISLSGITFSKIFWFTQWSSSDICINLYNAQVLRLSVENYKAWGLTAGECLGLELIPSNLEKEKMSLGKWCVHLEFLESAPEAWHCCDQSDLLVYGEHKDRKVQIQYDLCRIKYGLYCWRRRNSAHFQIVPITIWLVVPSTVCTPTKQSVFSQTLDSLM